MKFNNHTFNFIMILLSAICLLSSCGKDIEDCNKLEITEERGRNLEQALNEFASNPQSVEACESYVDALQAFWNDYTELLECLEDTNDPRFRDIDNEARRIRDEIQTIDCN